MIETPRFFLSYKSKSGDKNESKDACDTLSGLEAVLYKAEKISVLLLDSPLALVSIHNAPRSYLGRLSRRLFITACGVGANKGYIS